MEYSSTRAAGTSAPTRSPFGLTQMPSMATTRMPTVSPMTTSPGTVPGTAQPSTVPGTSPGKYPFGTPYATTMTAQPTTMPAYASTRAAYSTTMPPSLPASYTTTMPPMRSTQPPGTIQPANITTPPPATYAPTTRAAGTTTMVPNQAPPNGPPGGTTGVPVNVTTQPRDTAKATSRDQGSSPGAPIGPAPPAQGTTVGNNQQTMNLPTAAPTVPAGYESVPYNTREVYPYEPTADSATIDVYTGIMDYGKLTKLRERAVYDLNTLSYAPVADSATGILFPDAVRAKTEVESALRVRPTTFKGPQQLDIGEQQGDVHINRQMHPDGTNISNHVWYKPQGDLPFVGFPNPDLFYFYTDGIPTQNVQNLTHAQMTDLLRQTGGDYDHNNYLATVGALLRSGALAGPAHASVEYVISSDGGGVNGDPRMLERMTEDYERDFQKARRIRVADVTNDPRYGESAPGMAYTAEQHNFAEAQETQFSKITDWAGIGTSYTNPVKFHVG